jgi:hypothetical protein
MRDTSAAANFRKLAELHKATNEDRSGDGAIFAALCDLHEQSAADATELAGHFSECLKELHKAAGFDDLDALVPSQISGVTGDAPPSSLRMVPRSGQREISQFSPLDKTDKANETISKITSLD